MDRGTRLYGVRLPAATRRRGPWWWWDVVSAKRRSFGALLVCMHGVCGAASLCLCARVGTRVLVLVSQKTLRREVTPG